MKQLKKLLAGALATVVSATCMMSFTSSAGFMPFRDPNGDGKLNMADYICIVQYLAGLYIYTDMTQLDMNDNGIVSEVDAILLNGYLTEVQR